MKVKKLAGYAVGMRWMLAGAAVFNIGSGFAKGRWTMPATVPAPMTCCEPEPSTQPATAPAGVASPWSISGGSTITFGAGNRNDNPTTIQAGTLILAPATAAAPSPEGPFTATAPVMDALKRLHDVDAGLDSFTASAQKVDTDPRSGDEARLGTVYYQKDGTKTNLALQIDKYVVPGGEVPALKKDEKIAFVPPYLIRQDNVKKEFSRDEVVKPGAVVAPLKAGSGFPPLPIGQDPADLLKEFDITEVPVAASIKLPKGTNAADVIVLKLVPRVAKVYDFAQVQLVVDKKLNLPVVIEQTKLDWTVTTLIMDKVEINKLPAGTAKTVFDTTPPGAPWKVTLTPYK